MGAGLPVMWRVSLGILTLLPLTFSTSHTNRSEPSCVPSLNIPPNSQFSITEGQALILRCLVRSCSNKLPNVTWCRTQGGDVWETLTPGPGVFSKWEDDVYVLTLAAAHRNDTGYYRCTAGYGEWRITGKVITVNVIGPRGGVIRDTSKTWITYFSIALRLLMAVVFYTWVYCYLHHIRGNRIYNSKSISNTVKYVPPSKRAARCITKHTGDMSYLQPVHRDPPTESFEVICDDPDTCNDELSGETPQEQDPNTEE